MNEQPLPTFQVLTNREAVRLLPHKHYDRAQLLLFAGRREMGKTTALRLYIEEREPRVFILDPFNDFGTVRRRLQLSDAIADMQSAGLRPCRRRVVPPIDEGSIAYAEEFFEHAIGHLRDCLVVLDEITLWSHKHESVALRTLVLQGRRLGLRMAVACQRIALVPNVLLSETTEMLLFRMARPADLDTVNDWAGPEVSEQVSVLKQGQCVLVEP